MGEYRLETTLDRDGSLSLTGLPFHAGDVVEVIVQSHSRKSVEPKRYPLHGTPINFVNPTDPVAEEDWAPHL
jgi:hypothetical protein